MPSKSLGLQVNNGRPFANPFPDTFAVLTSLSPVIAALPGWLVLGQQLGLAGYLAIVLVTVASIGAVRSSRQHAPDGAPRVFAPSDVVPVLCARIRQR
jgi:hypothetical protein